MQRSKMLLYRKVAMYGVSILLLIVFVLWLIWPRKVSVPTGCHHFSRQDTGKIDVRSINSLKQKTNNFTDHDSNEFGPAVEASSNQKEQEELVGMLKVYQFVQLEGVDHGWVVPIFQIPVPNFRGFLGSVSHDWLYNAQPQVRSGDMHVPLCKNINSYLFFIRSTERPMGWRYVEVVPEALEPHGLVLPNLRTLPLVDNRADATQLWHRIREAEAWEKAHNPQDSAQ